MLELKRPSGISSWSVTFADMVTLILAYFIAILTTTSTANTANLPSLTAESKDASSGTPLAAHQGSEPIEDPTQRLSFAAPDVNLLTGELRPDAEKRLKEFVMSIRYLNAQVTLGACEGLVGPGVPAAQEVALRRQILDAGVPANKVGLSVLPISCSQEGAVAEVVVEMNEVGQPSL